MSNAFRAGSDALQAALRVLETASGHGLDFVARPEPHGAAAGPSGE
jgi:hypothetical protein